MPATSSADRPRGDQDQSVASMLVTAVFTAVTVTAAVLALALLVDPPVAR